MSKAHLLSSEEPLKPLGPLTVACGKVVEDPAFPFIWDSQGLGQPVGLSTLLLCRKCVADFGARDGARRYVYGVCEAKQLRIEASEAE